jgi:hypothetical protein
MHRQKYDSIFSRKNIFFKLNPNGPAYVRPLCHPELGEQTFWGSDLLKRILSIVTNFDTPYFSEKEMNLLENQGNLKPNSKICHEDELIREEKPEQNSLNSVSLNLYVIYYCKS